MSYYISPLSDLLGMTVSRCIHIAANGIISFFLMAEQYSVVYMYHIFFIHSSVYGQLGWFHVVAIVNSVAINIGVHVSSWINFSLCICLGVVSVTNLILIATQEADIISVFQIKKLGNPEE